MALAYVLVGGAVGLVVGLTSTGGGALLTPALLFLGVPAPVAVGSDVLVAGGMRLFGGGLYALRREVHWPTVARLAAGSIPGAALGIVLLNHVPDHLLANALRRGLGAVLILGGAVAVLRLVLNRKPRSPQTPLTAITVFLGALTGLLVSTTSVGSGSLLLCVLALFFPLSPQKMVGTDLVHALFVSSAATVGHVAAGRVDFSLSLVLLAGAIPGVLMGARLAWTVPQRLLRAGLAVTLIASGVQLTLSAPRAAVAPDVAAIAGGRG